MYTLGQYQQALCRLTSDDGTKKKYIHLVREADRLIVREGRGGPARFGIYLHDDGTLRVVTWDKDGEVNGQLRGDDDG